jgi:ABC-2 type transport system permease protein
MRGLFVQAKEQFRGQVRSVLIWGLSIGALGVMYMLLFPSMGKSVQQYINSLPSAYLQFLGTTGNLATPQGWLSMEMFNLVAPLSLPFFAMIVGARAIAGAEERGRMDVYLSNPVPRWGLVVSQFLSMALELAAMLGLIWFLTWMSAVALGVKIGAGPLAAAAVNLLPFSLFFGALALLLSAVVRRSATAVAVPAGLLVAMYAVNGVGGFSETVKPLRKFTLFYHYGSAVEHGVPWGSFLVILAAALLLLGLAVAAFEKRDIYT